MSIFGKKVRVEEIKGKKVQIYVLPAGEGIAMATKLAEVALPMLGGLGKDMQDGVTEADVDFGKIALAISGSLDKVDILAIIKRLLKDVTIDDSAVNFDDYFSCNYAELIAIMAFALKENFGSFFDVMDILGE